MELVAYEDADFALVEALETDPNMMRELGGPVDHARLVTVHRRRLNEPWDFKIVPSVGEPAVGTIGVWEAEHNGQTIHETGWMVLPQFQGRGIASAALALLLERVREERAIEQIHAFPSVTNGPSNALCRKFGFSLLGDQDFVFAGRTLHCNHWMLEL